MDESFKATFLADFLQALQPALGKVAMQKISYDMLPSAIVEISAAVKECLQDTWGSQGINVERVSIASATPTEESAEMIKSAQGDRLYAMNPAMQGARANAAASEAIKTAAGNEAGAMTGFMGVGMLNQGGAMFGANMSSQAQSQKQMTEMNVVGGGVAPVEQNGVKCPNCGTMITGNFCMECGTKKPEQQIEKFCSNCGEKASDTAKFCMNCGTKL